ncbi:DDE-type integrase/transposase/recombinase [Litorivita sp. NS0012-18]|uniref:DDE-type integrase/transposase/recombinase n=1 Tax=Litorivita sp. NS0012-18 TaxID=3127655 RepID=UPI003341242D
MIDVREINCGYDPHFASIRHIDKTWRNNLINSGHAAMKRILGPSQSFLSLRSAKPTLSGLETIRTIKPDHMYHKQLGVAGEIAFIDALFDPATA